MDILRMGHCNMLTVRRKADRKLKGQVGGLRPGVEAFVYDFAEHGGHARNNRKNTLQLKYFGAPNLKVTSQLSGGANAGTTAPVAGEKCTEYLTISGTMCYMYFFSIFRWYARGNLPEFCAARFS